MILLECRVEGLEVGLQEQLAPGLIYHLRDFSQGSVWRLCYEAPDLIGLPVCCNERCLVPCFEQCVMYKYGLRVGSG